MTRKEIIKKAIENKEIELDTAGLIASIGNDYIKKAAKNGEIPLDLAGLLLLAGN